MNWKDKLEKAGWRQTDKREYDSFTFEYIFSRRGEDKDFWLEAMGEIARTYSGYVEYFVPSWYNLPQD